MTSPEFAQGGEVAEEVSSDKVYWAAHAAIRAAAVLKWTRTAGMEHARQLDEHTGGALVAGTHDSLWDIAHNTLLDLNRPMRFLGKRDLLDDKLLRWIVRPLAPHAKVIFFDREDKSSRQSAGNLILEAVNNGDIVALYPEGRRNRTADPRSVGMLHFGAARTALHTEGVTPILPVASGYRKIKFGGKFVNLPLHSGFAAGPLIEVPYDTRPSALTELNDHLRGVLVELKAQAADLAYSNQS